MSFTLFFASGREARDPAGVNDCEMEGNGRSGRDVGNNDARFGNGRESVGEEGEARGEEMVGNVRVATDKDMVAKFVGMSAEFIKDWKQLTHSMFGLRKELREGLQRE